MNNTLKRIEALCTERQELLWKPFRTPSEQARRVARGLRGSDNKTVQFLSGRYTMQDIEAVPESEVIISPEGQITISGVNPLRKAGV